MELKLLNVFRSIQNKFKMQRRQILKQNHGPVFLIWTFVTRSKFRLFWRIGPDLKKKAESAIGTVAYNPHYSSSQYCRQELWCSKSSCNYWRKGGAFTFIRVYILWATLTKWLIDLPPLRAVSWRVGAVSEVDRQREQLSSRHQEQHFHHYKQWHNG